MLIKQEGRCAICSLSETSRDRNDKIKVLSVDHCHVTGKIRGLLCHSCNVGLGLFKDNIDTIQNAILYLKEKL
jgi:hypothetical protein